MSKSMEASIKTFTSELQARIDLFSSSTVSSNIDSNKKYYDEVKNIIENYDKNVLSLDLEDIYDLSLIDIKKILLLIGVSEEKTQELIDKLQEYPEDIETYKVVFNKVKLFIDNYVKINESQSELIESRISEYQKYIDLLSGKKEFEMIDDISELTKIMSQVNLSDADKWQVLLYVARNNNNITNDKIYDTNLVAKANDIVNKFMPEVDSDIYNEIAKYLKNKSVDIDLVPSIAEEIAFDTNLSKYDIQNGIVAIILNTLIEAYTNEEELEELENLSVIIKDAIKFIIPVTEEIIFVAKDILMRESDFYYTCIETGNDDFSHYQNTTITELEEEYGSREIAIDLKKLPLVKALIETLDHVETTEKTSEEYNLCCSTLVEIMDALNLIDEKKELIQ